MATKKKAKAAHGSGVCELGRKMLRERKTNAQILAAIHKQFPESNLKIGGVGWLRNDLRKKEKGIPTNGELNKPKAAAKAA